MHKPRGSTPAEFAASMRDKLQGQSQKPGGFPFMGKLDEYAMQGIDRNHPLPMTLGIAVPLWAHKLHMRPIEDIFNPAELNALAERLWIAGEAVIYRVEGKTADGFNALAEIIARLAFCPGGVRAFGMHWQYEAGKPLFGDKR